MSPGWLALLAAKEMVEAHLVERGAGGVGGDVAADAGMLPVGPHHHGHGVPADDAFDAPFDFPAAGKDRLPAGRNGIDIGRVGRKMNGNIELLGAHLEVAQQLEDPCRPLVFINIIEAFDPFPVFSRDLPGSGVGIFNGHGQIPFMMCMNREDGQRASCNSAVKHLPAGWYG